jgi:hypothetical protein
MVDKPETNKPSLREIVPGNPADVDQNILERIRRIEREYLRPDKD